jgi:hypothetical protein
MQDDAGRALFLKECIGGATDQAAFYHVGQNALRSSHAAFGG